MKSICIKCKTKHETDEKIKDFICTDCLKVIIQNNRKLVEEYMGIINKKSCLNCEHRKNKGEELPCNKCSFYSEWVLSW